MVMKSLPWENREFKFSAIFDFSIFCTLLFFNILHRCSYFNLQFFMQMENYYSRQGIGGRYESYQSSSARSYSPENYSQRRRSRSRSPVQHTSSSSIKKKQRHLQYQQYYEEEKALDKIKTNREEEEYNDYWTPSSSRNLPGGPKKVSTEKMSKREKSLRKDAQSLCEKELAEWDEQENELNTFLASRGGFLIQKKRKRIQVLHLNCLH